MIKKQNEISLPYTKQTCSWRDKLITLWKMHRQAKTFLHVLKTCIIIWLTQKWSVQKTGSED